MRAIKFLGANQIAQVQAEEPTIKEGEAKLKVAYAGICGSDINIYGGTHPRAKAGLIMGHEFSGTLCNDVGEFKKGDRVAVYPLISCGKCTPCINGNKHVCNTLGLYGIDKDGGFADYVAVPEDTLVKLPDTLSLKLGALIEPIAVAVHTIRETPFTPGDNAIIFGAGPIGLCVALTMRLLGARDIVVAETDEKRLAIAKELGFTTVNPIEQDIIEYTKQKTNGDGFDTVLDCAGAQAVANLLFDVIKVKGQLIIVAAYKKPAELPLFKGHVKELAIKFVRVYRKHDVEIATDLAQKEPLFEKLITHVLSPEEAQKGFDLFHTKGSGAVKIMYKFGEED